eukprot:scaffold80185_cov48-Phaeocystis_antarctica.AAC.1
MHGRVASLRLRGQLECSAQRSAWRGVEAETEAEAQAEAKTKAMAMAEAEAKAETEVEAADACCTNHAGPTAAARTRSGDSASCWVTLSTAKRKQEVRPATRRGPSAAGRGPRVTATPPRRSPSSSPPARPLLLLATVRISRAARSSISISSSISPGAALRSEQREGGTKRQPVGVRRAAVGGGPLCASHQLCFGAGSRRDRGRRRARHAPPRVNECAVCDGIVEDEGAPRHHRLRTHGGAGVGGAGVHSARAEERLAAGAAGAVGAAGACLHHRVGDDAKLRSDATREGVRYKEVERCGAAVGRLLQGIEAIAEGRLQGSQRGGVGGRGGVGERRGRTTAAAAGGGGGGGGG